VVTILPVKCLQCSTVVGVAPEEYNCTPGGNSLWVKNDALLILQTLRNTSCYKLSETAILSAAQTLLETRGCFDGNYRMREGVKNALRCVVKIKVIR